MLRVPMIAVRVDLVNTGLLEALGCFAAYGRIIDIRIV
jgi:hypothetical protein